MYAMRNLSILIELNTTMALFYKVFIVYTSIGSVHCRYTLKNKADVIRSCVGAWA